MKKRQPPALRGIFIDKPAKTTIQVLHEINIRNIQKNPEGNSPTTEKQIVAVMGRITDNNPFHCYLHGTVLLQRVFRGTDIPPWSKPD